MTGKPRYAIVRPPGDSFYRAVSDHKDRDRIDPKRARREHEDYCYLLGEMVEKIVELPKAENFPDSCFTQDMAIVAGGHALVARSGVPTRRGEGRSIAKALGPLVESVDEMPPPGTIEGGDVLRLGHRLLVGQSRRTSLSAIESLRLWAEPMGYRVQRVDVPRGILHLSTAVSVINDNLVMGLREVLRDPAFDTVNTLPIDEPIEACNVLVIGERIIASGDYEPHSVLEDEGYSVHRPDLGNFILADGGPTCLSLIVP